MSFIIDYCYSNLIPLMMGAFLVIIGHNGRMKDFFFIIIIFWENERYFGVMFYNH